MQLSRPFFWNSSSRTPQPAPRLNRGKNVVSVCLGLLAFNLIGVLMTYTAVHDGGYSIIMTASSETSLESTRSLDLDNLLTNLGKEAVNEADEIFRLGLIT